MTSLLIAVAALLALAPAAAAHEGHGDPAWYGSVVHYLIEPVHLPVTFALLIAVVHGSKRVSNKLLQRTARARRR